MTWGPLIEGTDSSSLILKVLYGCCMFFICTSVLSLEPWKSQVFCLFLKNLLCKQFCGKVQSDILHF